MLRSISLLLAFLLGPWGLPAAALAAPPDTPSAPEKAAPFLTPARLEAGRGVRILEIDGEPREVAQADLAPGVHSLRFESRATVEPIPGRRFRQIHEVCEARFRARSGVLYVLVQEVVASRGARSWHHQLSSFVQDEERERAVGECVCRTAPLE